MNFKSIISFHKMKQNMSTLSDYHILEYINSSEIVIEPFNNNNLNTSSYDVTLGEYYYREQEYKSMKLYNMYSSRDIKDVWGSPKKASRVKDLDLCLENINEDDKIIVIRKGETILCHTNEFIGGTSHITTMMKARSSIGRNFLEVCKCAGWGDVGYINRWTMEITNNSKYYDIPLVVGRRIAQIVFFDVNKTNNTNYSKSGKYQSCIDLDVLKQNWSPDEMLPKMHLDKDILLLNE